MKGSHNLNVLLKPFEAFKEFVTNYTKLQNPDYASILLKNINTKKIALLGINSALIGRKEADRKINDQGKLMIGEP